MKGCGNTDLVARNGASVILIADLVFLSFSSDGCAVRGIDPLVK